MSNGRLRPNELRVIAPSLGKRYSGINASMLAVLPELAKHEAIAATGFHIPESVPQIPLKQFLLGCRGRRWRIWHARRNIEMLVGLILRYVFRRRLILLFTSAAQRPHTWLTRFYYSHMDAVIATTDASASYLKCSNTVVCHGVDTDRFSPSEDRDAAWSAKGLAGKYGIGVFGRIRPSKGSEDFVDAMLNVLPERPDWSVVFIGQTAEEHHSFEQKLREKINAAGLTDRFHFTGFLNNPDEVPLWYRSLHVVVCPSRVEGFGLPALEAMASGAPVVATRTGAWQQIISEGKDGYLVPCQHVEALSEAILKITADPNKVKEMGKAARMKVLDGYRIQDEAAGIMGVYNKLFEKYGY